MGAPGAIVVRAGRGEGVMNPGSELVTRASFSWLQENDALREREQILYVGFRRKSVLGIPMALSTAPPPHLPPGAAAAAAVLVQPWP